MMNLPASMQANGQRERPARRDLSIPIQRIDSLEGGRIDSFDFTKRPTCAVEHFFQQGWCGTLIIPSMSATGGSLANEYDESIGD